MGKKKKFNKSSKQYHPNLPEISAEQHIKQGKAFLEQGKARDAINVLKLAEKKDSSSATIRQLLYRAYLLREDQLRSKGLIPEADAVKKIAFELMPPPDQLTERDMLDYIPHSTVKESLELYLRFLKGNSQSAAIDQHIACRLMISEDWESLNVLDLSHPLRRDIQPLKEAVSLMNQGNWEDALLILKTVPRNSPYASMRLFCRAMVLLYQNKDADALQIFAGIPDDYPLRHCIESIKLTLALNDPSDRPARPGRRLQCFWEGLDHPDKIVSDLLTHLKNNQLKQAAFCISNFARAIFPNNPIFAIQQILEILLFSSDESKKTYAFEDFKRMCQSLLPEPNMSLLMAKVHMHQYYISEKSVNSYLSLLDKEIQNPDHRNMVAGMILQASARMMNDEKSENRFSNNPFSHLDDWFGKSGSKQDSARDVLKMVVRSIELDPQNREAYTFLITLPRHSRPDWDRVEQALQKMSSVFPDDPFPCLELATLYYEKNAFRKAERILEEAAMRAPHDNRVIGQRALSLVISACKNLQREKYHLVPPDLEKADALNSKKVALVIAEKKSLLDLVTHPDQSEKNILQHFSLLDALDRIRAMGLLLQDVRNYGKKLKSKSKLVENCLTQELRRLSPTPADITTLLSPFPKEFKPALPEKMIAHTLLSMRTDLFGVIPDADLIPTFELIFDQDILGFMGSELQKRLRKKHQPKALPMLFFLITLKHMTGTTFCEEKYQDALAMADDPMKSELETLSKKLSRHASGLLQESLEHFDFKFLEGSGSFFNDLDFDDPDFDDDDDNDDDFDDFEDFDKLDSLIDMMNDIKPVIGNMNLGIEKEDSREFVKDIEDIVDQLDIRGLPAEEIREMRNLICSMPQMKKTIDMISKIAIFLDPANLSREAKILLLPKNKKYK